jgi:hypothetical protein
MKRALETPVTTEAAISHGRLVKIANIPHPPAFSRQPVTIMGL